MTRQAKTKATPTTMPSNFQNKCCSIRAERQLLNSFLLDELQVIFSTYPVEAHSGVVLIWKLEHGVHSSVTTNSSTNQHGEVEVLTDSFSSRTGASASQSFKVKAHSNQQRWPPRGRPRLPAPAGMGRSGSHLLQPTSPSSSAEQPDVGVLSLGQLELYRNGLVTAASIIHAMSWLEARGLCGGAGGREKGSRVRT